MEEGAMCMDLYNVQKLLQARVLTGSELMHRQIESCCGSDMHGTDKYAGSAHRRYDGAERTGICAWKGA